MKIHFLNVDLEIRSYRDLQPIVKDFGNDVRTLYCGEACGHYLATFEAKDEGATADADSMIAHFCLLVQSLEQDAKELWDSAFTKVFDIGYTSGSEPRSYSSELRSETIEQVASVGAALRITIYPPR